MADPPPATVGVDHVGLSVGKLESTQRFFCDCLGWNVVGERPDYPAVFVSDGSLIVTLWQGGSPANPLPFYRPPNVGLPPPPPPPSCPPPPAAPTPPPPPFPHFPRLVPPP